LGFGLISVERNDTVPLDVMSYFKAINIPQKMNCIQSFNDGIIAREIDLTNRLVSYFLGSPQSDVWFLIFSKKEKKFSI
jgi:hypothetical protein